MNQKGGGIAHAGRPMADPFVGREHELQRLQAAVMAALSGRGSVLLVGGEPGIGKTRTCEELAEYARGCGASVVWGRCYEGEGAPAFWPWVQIIRSCITDLDAGRLQQTLGAGASAIGQLVSPLGTLVEDGVPLVVTESPESRFRLFDAVVRLLEYVSQQTPLVLILDDLQGADASSLLLLQFVARQLHEARLLTVGTYRDLPLPSDDPLSQTLRELARVSGRAQLTLAGLSAPEVAAYLRHTVGIEPPAALVAALHRQTEGNPLFVGEFVRMLIAEHRLEAGAIEDVAHLSIPASVRVVIKERLAPLSDTCKEVLRVAAVIGREFRVDVLQRLQDTAVTALQEAAAARIIVRQPGSPARFRFTHALIRETLYDDLLDGERTELHGRVGTALEHMPHIAECLPELAYHFFEARNAGGRDKAIAYAQQAGDRAMTLLAYEEAVRLYQLGLEALGRETADAVSQTQRCGLLLALGEAQRAAGDGARSKQTLLQAAGLARVAGAPALLARAALGYGTKYPWGDEGAVDETLVQLLEQAVAMLGEDASALHARLLARLAMALQFAPKRDRRLLLGKRAVEMARGLGDPRIVAYALHARHVTMSAADNLSERLAIATEIIQLAEQTRDLELVFWGHASCLLDRLERGDRGSIDAELEVCRQLADQLREPFYRWLAVAFSVECAVLEGRFAGGEELAQQGLAIGQTINTGAEQAFGVQMYVRHLTQGQPEALAALAAMFAGLAAQYPAVPAFHALLAAAYAELGRAPEARAQFEPLAQANFADFPFDQSWLMSLCQLAQVCAFLGDTRRAASLYDMLVPFGTLAAVISGGGGYLGPVAHYLGMLATLLSRWGEAQECFESALVMNAAMRARPWLARTQYEYAAMLSARGQPGDRDQAVYLTTAALATATELGMTNLREKVAGLWSLASGPAIEPQATDQQPETRDQEAGTRNHGPGTTDRRPETGIFRKEGDYWMVAQRGVVLRLKDSKGMQYIARLLEHPGQEFHVLDLAVQESGVRGQEPGNKTRRQGPTTAILDARARSEYTQRLAELREALEEAERHHDAGRSARLSEELHAISEQLAAAVGLGGRNRAVAQQAQRARVAVTKRIRETIERVRAGHPELGHYLATTINTGQFCSYVPDPVRPVMWTL